MIEQRWEVKIGSPVLATDGEFGRLQQLILDPHQERIIALLVQRHGLATSRIAVVPSEEVADATAREVRLKISRGQAEALPEYRPDTRLTIEGWKYTVNDDLFAARGTHGIEVGHAPGTLRPGMTEGQPAESEQDHLALRLCAGQRVFCQNEQVGRVSLILFDPEGQVKGFVMRAGHLHGRHLIVPVAWIQEVDSKNVYLSINRWVPERLLDYRPDDVLVEEANNALWADEILRATDYAEIDVTVQDGIVGLHGHVITPINKSRAENAVRSLVGVLGVENHLVVDDDLVIDVAQALARDDRTREERVTVSAHSGVIVLNGRVANAAVREVIEEVAASVPRVRGISNYIQAPGVVVDPEEQKVLHPPIGQGVSATDMLLGHVERVIIDPHNRRVTAFVTHGCFSNRLRPDEDDLLDLRPVPERRVVVPIRAVRYATDSSVLLNVSSCEAARYRDFDSADFVSPSEGWQPPYPYQWNEVLFKQESRDEPKN
jgi:osmotically-inducible protein OsmY/sporulation protein YlmC with PRC-barrel domain